MRIQSANNTLRRTWTFRNEVGTCTATLHYISPSYLDSNIALCDTYDDKAASHYPGTRQEEEDAACGDRYMWWHIICKEGAAAIILGACTWWLAADVKNIHSRVVGNTMMSSFLYSAQNYTRTLLLHMGELENERTSVVIQAKVLEARPFFGEPRRIIAKE